MTETTEATRVTGKIKKIKVDEGWGFISSLDIPFTRIFFHWSALDPTIKFTELQVGQKVEFEAHRYIDKNTNEDKGMRAFKIKLIE